MSRFQTFIRGATAVAAIVLLSGCESADQAEAPATVVQQSELQLPAGFEAQVVFEGTGEAREIYVRADGDLFVSLSGLRDGNHILRVQHH